MDPTGSTITGEIVHGMLAQYELQPSQFEVDKDTINRDSIRLVCRIENLHTNQLSCVPIDVNGVIISYLLDMPIEIAKEFLDE